MAGIVALGAGLGGTPVAFELGGQQRPEDRLTPIGQSGSHQFVPFNPWGAIGRRTRKDIEVDLTEVVKPKNSRSTRGPPGMPSASPISATVAWPQIPPRNVNRASKGAWARHHAASPATER